MFTFLCRKLVQNSIGISVGDSTTQLHFLQSNPLSLRFLSTSTNAHSFVVSYLMDSCGLSHKPAVAASKRVQFGSSKRPDAVLTVFRNHGFTKTQISKLIKRTPLLLVANSDKTLKPKFEFFSSLGFSPTDLAKLFTSDSTLLTRSLKNHIIPSFEFLKNVLHTDDKVVAAIKNDPWILLLDLQKIMTPNMKVLRDHGVPESKISKFLVSEPTLFLRSPDRFWKATKEIKEMGFDPSRSTFIIAIKVLTDMKKSSWEGKLEVYRRWGWSDDNIISAFRQHPGCMSTSVKKITRIMDFLVNKMGLESSILARHSAFISLSMDRRIIPRCAVIQTLLSKGLIQKNFKISTVLATGENYFLNKFVTKYQEEIPQLLKVYQEMISSKGLATGFEKLGEMDKL